MRKTFCDKCGKEITEDVEWVFSHELCHKCAESIDIFITGRWISIEDGLPNIDERVLVYIPKPDNHYNIEIAYISEGNDDCPYWVLGDRSQFYSTRFHYISHWMPMPEPPQD